MLPIIFTGISETITSAPVITVLACLIAAFFAFRHYRIQRFDTAADKFRKEFDGIITYLESRNPDFGKTKNWAHATIEKSIQSHDVAARAFAPNLSSTRQAKFWEAYHEYEDPKDFREQYKGEKYPQSYSRCAEYFTENIEEENRIRRLILTRINHILSFAKKY